MKKYVKPSLIVERYELSQSIADCAWELNNVSKDTCHAEPDKNIFGDSYSGTLFTSTLKCTYQTDGGYENYCYQNGSNSPFSVFKS